MRFEDLTPEQIEKAKKCETHEERLAFIKENGIELTDEQLEDIAGGAGALEDRGAHICPKNKWGHKWKSTGRTRPGAIWGDVWPDYEMKCVACGKLDWDWFKH
jgi:hypothetical protein